MLEIELGAHPDQGSNEMNPDGSNIAITATSDNAMPTPIPENNRHETLESSEHEARQRKRACYTKMAVSLVLGGIIAFIIADSLTNRYVRSGITTFLEWIEVNPGAGVLAFTVAYFAATVLFVPGSILTLGAGFVFSSAFGLGLGVCLGTLAVFVGASAGALVAFLLGRYLFRDSVSGLSKKYIIFEALDTALAEKGFRIMLLLRLSPIIPFNFLNYIAGVTAISFWSYFWANFGFLPGTILYVFLGASAGSLTDSANSGGSMTVTVAIVVVGVIFGLFALVVTSYYARQELNKVAAKRQAELEASQQQEHQQQEQREEGEDEVEEGLDEEFGARAAEHDRIGGDRIVNP